MKNFINSFLAICLFAVATVSFSACSNANAATEDTTTEKVEAPAKKVNMKVGEPIKVGEKAPSFKLKNIDGEYYALEDIKDANGNQPKGYVVTFTCNTCPFAVKYEDRLVELDKKMSPLGYPVVAVMPNDITLKPGDSFENMQQRAEDKGFTFPYMIDETQEVFKQYGASRTPEIFLLDADLTLRYHGAIDDNAQDASAVTVNYVEGAVDAISKGQDPDPSKVKAIGCSIKYQKS